MKKRYVLLSIALLLALVMFCMIFGYSRGMTGIVVDSVTGKPVEGAVVYAEWTKTKGIGLTYTELYKITEKITDKNGKFRVFGVFSPFVNPPTVVIYKRGYVAWRNDYIFPGYERRYDFEWKNTQLIKLEHFKRNYSHSKHIFFFRGGLNLGSSKLEQAYSWEDPLASKEEELLRKKIKTLKPGESEGRIWEEIIQELYFQKGETSDE